MQPADAATCCCPTTYLESEDDGPDKTKCQAGVAVHNVMGTHVLQVHPLFQQEADGLVHILQAVDTHLALCRSWLQPYKQQINYVKYYGSK